MPLLCFWASEILLSFLAPDCSILDVYLSPRPVSVFCLLALDFERIPMSLGFGPDSSN